MKSIKEWNWHHVIRIEIASKKECHNYASYRYENKALDLYIIRISASAIEIWPKSAKLWQKKISHVFRCIRQLSHIFCLCWKYQIWYAYVSRANTYRNWKQSNMAGMKAAPSYLQWTCEYKYQLTLWTLYI